MLSLYKKNGLFFLLIAIFSAINGFAHDAKNVHEFPHINMQNIADQKQKIEILLQHDRRFKIASISGFSIAMAGLLFVCWQGMMSENNENPVVKTEVPKIEIPQSYFFQETTESMSLDARLSKMQEDINKLLAFNVKRIIVPSGIAKVKQLASWVWSQFTFSFLASLASMASHPVLKYFKAFDRSFDKVIEKIFHENNLAWFLKNKNTIMPILDDIEQQLCGVNKDGDLHAKPDVKKHESSSNKESISRSWALAIQNLESVLAFMYVEADIFAKNSLLHADHAKSIANRIIMLTDNCSMEISYALAKDQQAVFNIIHAYKIALQNEIMRFDQCENFLVTA